VSFDPRCKVLQFQIDTKGNSQRKHTLAKYTIKMKAKVKCTQFIHRYKKTENKIVKLLKEAHFN